MRRGSFDTVDLFHAHIGGMDTFARALVVADKLHQGQGARATPLTDRYAGYRRGMGKKIMKGKTTLPQLETMGHEAGRTRPGISGRQELLENILNEYILGELRNGHPCSPRRSGLRGGPPAGCLCCMAGEPRTHDIPRLEGVSVDGEPADWKGGGFEVRQLLEVNGAVIAPEDLTASFRLGWDNHGLLVFVRVADDVFTEAAEEDELYRKDSVELYVSSAWGVKNTIQSVIAPGMTPDHSDPRWHIHEGRSEELAGVEVDLAAARRKVEGGYEIEVRIPLSSLGVDPVVGQEMGFQLYVNDADAPAGTYAETYHAVWFPRYGALNDPTAMYRIRFAESASLPVRAAARIADLRPEGVTLRTVGEAELMDHPAVIVGGDEVVATGMFAKVAGLAKAELLIPADMTTGRETLPAWRFIAEASAWPPSIRRSCRRPPRRNTRPCSARVSPAP